MRHETYNGKKVIWESKLKQITVIFISFIFISIALFLGENQKPIFWITILLFGIGGIFMLIRLLNPNNLFVTYNSELGKKILAEREEKFNNDLGMFEYDENGFAITIELYKKYYQWKDIEKIYSYKVDLLSYDEICLDIFTNDEQNFTLTESSPGWFQFITRLSENITSIRLEWFFELANPAFEKNLTLLYDKINGIPKEIRKHYS